MNVRKYTILAILTALGIVLQLLEGFLPTTFIVPGFKIGFANIVTLTVLMLYGAKEMVIAGALRIVLASLLTGSFLSVSFWVSASGFICAAAAMIGAKKSGIFSIYGISVAGAASHALGQVGMITWIYQQYFMQLYAPALIGLAIFSGLVVAALATSVIQRIEGRSVIYG